MTKSDETFVARFFTMPFPMMPMPTKPIFCDGHVQVRVMSEEGSVANTGSCVIWPVDPTAHLASVQISSHRGDESKGNEEHAHQHAVEEGVTFPRSSISTRRACQREEGLG